jgi:predicted dehydrogenase
MGTGLNAADNAPVKIGVAGLTHGHVKGFLRRAAAADGVKIVGVVEPDSSLASEFAETFSIDPKILYSSLDSMLETARPDAVVVYTSTARYPEIVKACAARGVHVMLEKPLAVSIEAAKEIESVAKSSEIHVLVNYETNWMPSVYSAHAMVFDQEAIGEVRKIEIQIGHQGPVEIGSTPQQFVDWLGDPEAGGGTLLDFGSYGANIATWMMDGKKPNSVFCLNLGLKPDTYPKVEDETTIILAYDQAVAILQGSWNSPVDRKDLQVYGEFGYVKTVQQQQIELMVEGMSPEVIPAEEPEEPENEQIPYLCAVVRGEITPEGRPSLAYNVTVMEILDAARKSAETGKLVSLQ